MIVYSVTKKKTNEIVYIGQTVGSLAKRKCDHFYEARRYKNNMVLSRAIRKYGEKAFVFKREFETNSIAILNNAEIFLIGYYDTFHNGYNGNMGGENALHSEKTKKKLSAQKIGKNNPFWGKHLSDKHKAKISKSTKGIKNHNYRKEMSDEIKLKISKGIGDKNTGINNWFYGKKHSIKTKKRLAEIRESLSRKQVIKIKKLLLKYVPQVKIAKMFNVNRIVITLINTGRTYRDVYI